MTRVRKAGNALRARRASLAVAGIALLAVATLLVDGGRSFGKRLPVPIPDPSAKERMGGPIASDARDRAPTWLVAGPFRAEGLSGLEDPLDRDYLAQAGLAPSGEGSAAPLRVGSGSSELWRETAGMVAAADGSYGVDFIAELGDTIDSVAYAYREVESSSPGEALLKIGSDDGIKLWINGSLVLANHVKRALLPGEDSILVPLVKGRNRILAKIGQARGNWGFSLNFTPVGKARDAARAEDLRSLGTYPDDLSIPPGGTIRGTVMSKSLVADGIGEDWTATVELLDPSGAVRAEARSRVGGRFSLPLPAGLSGPFRIRARGSGELARVPSPATPLFLGNAAASAERAVALARSPSAAKTAAARFPEIPDPAATLEILARAIEGSLPSSVAGFDLALQALAEVEALAGTAEAGDSFPRGLWRYAFTSSLDGSVQPYSLYLPRGYKREGRYGLVVNLHGASGSDLTAAAPLAAAEPPDMLVLAPYCRGDLAYAGAGERDALDAMDLVRERYAIDVDRVYLSGSSMGGYGTWRLAKLYPWRFAAAASFAGWTDLDMLENLSGMPLLVVHGDVDPVVPSDPDKRAVGFLRANGNAARLDLLPKAGHNAFEVWTAKEGADRLFSWFRRFKRESWPASIKVRTTMARAGKGAWASILGTERPPRMAAIDARIVDERHIVVETDNVSAFELDLRHPRLAKGGRILILADGVNLTADSGSPQVRFELGPEGRFAPAPPRAGEALPNGSSGLVAVFDSPLRIVYGTRKRSRSAEAAEIARAVAEAMRLAGLGSVEILSDSEAEKAGPGADKALLLVGNPDESSALAALAPKLPIAWKDGRYRAPDGRSTGTGLILVCPDPSGKKRLIGVLAPPARGKAAAGFARGLLAGLSGQTNQGTCGYGTPDAVILSPTGAAQWIGFFDWRWERLKASDFERK
jgi:poly(3-hydroxybutyrate) depolymerase